MPHTTQSIAELVAGDLVGPGDTAIDGLEEIALAKPGHLTFIGSEKYAGKWAGSEASAALISRDVAPDLTPGEGKTLIRVDSADLAMAKVLEAFAPATPLPEPGVDPTAIVATTATLGPGVRIGPNCVVKPGASIGEGTILHGGVTVYDDSHIGSHCEIWTGTVIRERCSVGDRCILHANAVVGADGFGYRPDFTGPTPKLVKIPQIGTVQIGSDVEIGAGTTIDRAKFGATVIGDACKLDNQIQIAHNVVLGQMVIIAACSAIAGSSTIGDGTMIGGLTCVSDHITLGQGVKLAGGSACINDIPDGETWGGVPAKPLKTAFQEQAALKQLPEMLREMKRAKRKADKQKVKAQD